MTLVPTKIAITFPQAEVMAMAEMIADLAGQSAAAEAARQVRQDQGWKLT